MSATTEGMRFSHVYLLQPELLPDSKRMRHRLGIAITSLGGPDFLQQLGQHIEREHGIPVHNARYKDYWPNIVQKFELRDVLDLITVVFNFISDTNRERLQHKRNNFIFSCRRIFEEEQVRYKIDDRGGVRFSVDVEFEAHRTSTILTISSKRYTAVRTLYEEAYLHLDKSPPDAKSALRSSFNATECLFRLMFSNAHQLSASEVQKHLEPLVNRLYDGQKPAINLAQKLVASLKDWIDGAHFYRHEPGSEEPVQPPLELAIYMLSEASGHIRWLAKLDEMNS
ncbi:hypothetical protein [Agrobacterium sp. Azo12]|jgi:hypothetical protein|uniref:hypothetical protein n=1 Tax=Agrobacterium sp. Azo12 TaxID=3031129 RepID=UPI0023D80841|nr:hypothetical protein [Agrobacterium sp. Azo12]MDO5895983.1 hypothetical protein [Agrobacterium sp. Azo12]